LWLPVHAVLSIDAIQRKKRPPNTLPTVHETRLVLLENNLIRSVVPASGFSITFFQAILDQNPGGTGGYLFMLWCDARIHDVFVFARRRYLSVLCFLLITN